MASRVSRKFNDNALSTRVTERQTLRLNSPSRNSYIGNIKESADIKIMRPARNSYTMNKRSRSTLKQGKRGETITVFRAESDLRPKQTKSKSKQ